MINSIRNLLVIFILYIFSLTHAFAEDSHEHGESNQAENHAHEEKKSEHAHDEKESHGENEEHDDAESHAEDDHDHHEEGGHEEEGGAKVGSDKGITEKSESGFKLSKEAIAAFNLKFKGVSGVEIEVSKAALVHIKNGKYVYRIRNGWISRVPINVTSLSSGQVKVKSHDLNDGDQIVTFGTGFIRGAELILSEGATHSH
ncbi:MAG: hypothetical protein A2Z20_07950 [Bdellovibrionales bacterium RBG_16_40_8]|nr:MAG: hypothetical protein A2Z20_07950 [Bdellovibrionales bacterium RBG_16_40_8]